MRIALAFAALIVLGGSVGIVLATRDSDGVVSLGAPPAVAGSEISSTLPTQPSFEVWFSDGESLAPVARTQSQFREAWRTAVSPAPSPSRCGCGQAITGPASFQGCC